MDGRCAGLRNSTFLTDEAVSEAPVFADMAGQALRLALRIATADLLAADLKAGMARRTVIDLSTGIIGAENRCTQDQAFDFLHKALQNRNQKLHEVASNIIAERNGTHTHAATHFHDWAYPELSTPQRKLDGPHTAERAIQAAEKCHVDVAFLPYFPPVSRAACR